MLCVNLITKETEASPPKGAWALSVGLHREGRCGPARHVYPQNIRCLPYGVSKHGEEIAVPPDLLQWMSV